MRYEVIKNRVNGYWWVYRVTGNGANWELCKTFKTEQGARNWIAKH